MLALLFVLTPGCSDWLPGADPTPVENRREGSPDWQLSRPAGAGEIEGYASAASARPGDRISLHVSTRSRRFDVRIYRLGWYGGAGARQIHEKRGIPGGIRTRLQPNPADGLVACDWPASVTFRIGRRWTTGVYLARLTGADDGMQAFVPFVVREGRGRRRAPFVLPIAVATWQAYNNWGGKSLYDFNSVGGQRALRVSFDRPYAAGEGAWAGLGAGELLTVAHAPRKAGWEYPMIRWLEREGYDVAYATTIDLDADSTTFDGRRAILVAGHDEYWTRGVRDRFEAARDRGVNLAFFGANLGYWQVRLEPSKAGVPRRTIFCAKDHTLDPVVDTEADRDLTVHFRHLHPRRPENALIGVMTAEAEEPVEGAFVPTAAASASWVFHGTAAARGDSTAIPGIVGYEVDRSFASDELFGAWTPRGLEVLGRSGVRLRDGRTGTSEATLYRASSGAFVFAAGTVQWSWGLDDWGAPALRPALAHPDVRRVTANLMQAFGRAPAPSPIARSPR